MLHTRLNARLRGLIRTRRTWRLAEHVRTPSPGYAPRKHGSTWIGPSSVWFAVSGLRQSPPILPGSSHSQHTSLCRTVRGPDLLTESGPRLLTESLRLL